MTGFVANTNVLELDGLQDAIAQTYINAATVTVTVKDAAGSPVVGQTWPATMAYVTSSNGKYRCELDNTLELEARTVYYAHIQVEDAGRTAFWKFLFKAQERTS
jgi:hypothetical protein